MTTPTERANAYRTLGKAQTCIDLGETDVAVEYARAAVEILEGE